MRVYHYTSREHKPGDVITAGRDSLLTFSGPKEEFEKSLRDGHPGGIGHDIRSKALYTWESNEFIRAIWKYIPAKYLYELEIDEADILHRSNLNHYNDGIDAAKQGRPLDHYVKAYWSNDPSPDPKPRIEVLVTKATVIQLILSR